MVCDCRASTSDSVICRGVAVADVVGSIRDDGVTSFGAQPLMTNSPPTSMMKNWVRVRIVYNH